MQRGVALTLQGQGDNLRRHAHIVLCHAPVVARVGTLAVPIALAQRLTLPRKFPKMYWQPPGPTHPRGTDGQGAVLQLAQAPAGYHRHPVLAPADEGHGVAPGVTVKEGITAGVLHLVGAGVPLDDGCLWEREKNSTGGGLARHPIFPAGTYL